jgi:hypothetical protein
MRDRPNEIQEKSHSWRTEKLPYDPWRHRASDDLKERVVTDLVLWAGLAAIVALCVMMSMGLYYWSRYAPLFPPDTGSAMEEAIPWSS